MSLELATYKSMKLSQLKKIYDANVINITKYYTYVINSISNNRKIANSIRLTQINSVRNILNAELYNLKNTYVSNQSKIINFVQTKIVINKSKKALLIGINYTGTQYQLNGCINDTESIKTRLKSIGFNDNDITIMTDVTNMRPTRDNILQSFQKLLVNSEPGDLLFFFFSGHGSYILDKNGDDATGYDQSIVSSDFQAVIDDELKSIILKYLKKNVTLFGLFDSCFSGSVLDLKCQYYDSLNYDNFVAHTNEIETDGNVIMISGCTDKQTSADAEFNNKANGALTWSLLETLKIKQSNTMTWRSLIRNMRDILKKNNFEQIPQLSSGQFVDVESVIFI
jgi:hypothetical protein